MVVDDLAILGTDGLAAGELGQIVGPWARVEGPSGRFALWITPDDSDLWWIEGLMVY